MASCSLSCVSRAFRVACLRPLTPTAFVCHFFSPLYDPSPLLGGLGQFSWYPCRALLFFGSLRQFRWRAGPTSCSFAATLALGGILCGFFSALPTVLPIFRTFFIPRQFPDPASLLALVFP